MMMNNVSISRTALAELLLGALGRHRGDEDYVPLRFQKYLDGIFDRRSRVVMPFPEPWGVRSRGASVMAFAGPAGAVIEQSLELWRFSEVAGSEERGISAIARTVGEFVDELCPRPPGKPIKGPWPPSPPTGTDILVVAALFQRASDEFRQKKVGQVFSDASARLFEAGIERLAQEGMGEQLRN
jgi:hypothetical protein